jgi:hypothetical protein
MPTDPTDPPDLAVTAGSENIHFIGTPTTLAGTISDVGVVCIGSPVVGVPSAPSPDSDGGGEAVVEGSGCQGREPVDESSFCPGLARCFDCGFASAQDRMTSA